MDFAVYRKGLRDQLLRYKVLNMRVRGRVSITEEEAREFYNNQVRDVRSTTMFEGAHILIRVKSGAKATEVAAARKRVHDIRARIDAGEDFADVAEEESEDEATASYGGELGELRHGEIPNLLDRAFLDMEVDEVTGPIRTAAGFHILILNWRESLGVQSFASVKDRIISQLTQTEMARQERVWLQEIRSRVFVDVRM